MKLSVESHVLAGLAGAVRPAVARSTTKEALRCVKFAAAGDTLSLSATDCELSVTATAAGVPTLRSGACLVDAEKLKALLAAAPRGALLIAADEKSVVVKGTGCKWDFPIRAVEEFPDAPAEGDRAAACELPAGALATLFDRTLFAIARPNDLAKGAQHGVRLTLSPAHLTAVGTDSKRLSVAKYSFDQERAGLSHTAVVPKGAVLAALAALADPAEVVELSLGNLFCVRTERISIQSQTVHENTKFPYEEMIAKYRKSAKATATVDPEALLSAVRQVATMATLESCRVEVKLGPEGLAFALAHDLGGAESECPVAGYEGDPTHFAADPAYLREFLTVLVGGGLTDPVPLRTAGPEKPFVFDASPDWSYLVQSMVS